MRAAATPEIMYLNVVQLAESFGVEERVVNDWVRHDGLPHLADRGRLLFDRAQVANWAVQRGLTARVGFLTPSAPGSGLALDNLLRTGGIWRDAEPGGVLDILERAIGAVPGVSPPVRQLLAQRLRAPRALTWAPVGGGLALPHLRTPVALGRDAGVLALLFLREGLVLEDPPPDGQPVNRLAFFLAPSPRAHLEILGRLSTALARGALRALLLRQAPDAEIFAALTADGPAATEGIPSQHAAPARPLPEPLHRPSAASDVPPPGATR